jgi:hypothetical protein
MTTALASRFALAFAAFASLSVAACAASPGDGPDESIGATADAVHDAECPASVPAALDPAADQDLAWEFDGVGVQVYLCEATASSFTWTLIGPSADLYRHDGDHHVGVHYAGPTWQDNDGSSVVGAKVAAATVDATAVPWLLLTAASHGATEGRFSDVTSIQRMDTVGGVAPVAGCDAAHVSALAEIPYSAHYFFYKTKAHGHVDQCGG